MRTKEEVKERLKKMVSRPYFPYGITPYELGEMEALLWVLEILVVAQEIPIKDFAKWLDETVPLEGEKAKTNTSIAEMKEHHIMRNLAERTSEKA
jgi:hypothetical protein